MCIRRLQWARFKLEDFAKEFAAVFQKGLIVFLSKEAVSKGDSFFR